MQETMNNQRICFCLWVGWGCAPWKCDLIWYVVPVTGDEGDDRWVWIGDWGGGEGWGTWNKNLSQCQFIRHKSHMDYLGTEFVLERWGGSFLSPEMGSCLMTVIPLCLSTTPWKCMGSARIAARILNFGTRSMWVVSFTLRPLCTPEKSWHLFVGSLINHRSGLDLPIPGIEPQSSILWQVIVLTDMYREWNRTGNYRMKIEGRKEE
jgi:hypothetical protein